MDNNSSLTKDSLAKLQVNNHTIMIYAQYKFYEIPFITSGSKHH